MGPIASLEQIVGLEQALVGLVRVVLEHGPGIEIPDRRPTHDVETEGSKDREVHGGVDLFHEPGLFGPGVDAARLCQRADEPLHEEFAGEGEDDDVEGDEGEVAWSFAVLGWGVGTTEGVGGDERRGGRERVGEEEGAVEGIACGGIDEVEGDYEQDEDERVDPCVAEGEVSPASNESAGFSAFAVVGGFGVGRALVGVEG